MKKKTRSSVEEEGLALQLEKLRSTLDIIVKESKNAYARLNVTGLNTVLAETACKEGIALAEKAGNQKIETKLRTIQKTLPGLKARFEDSIKTTADLIELTLTLKSLAPHKKEVFKNETIKSETQKQKDKDKETDE